MKCAEATILFSPLPQPRHRSGAFAIGFGLQFTAMVLLWTLAASAPRVVQQQFAYIKLTAPSEPIVWQQPTTEAPVEAPKPVHRLVKVRRRRFATPVLPAPVAVPSLEVAIETPIQPRPEPKEVAPVQQPPQVQHQVRATNFGSAATPTLPKMASRKVQTGGFGDPNGVPRSAQPNSGKVHIAAIGSFDLPAGPGYGNGSGGARGLRGVIPNAGFGNGAVTDARPSPRGHVMAASFGVRPPEPEIKRAAPLPQKPTVVPVTIREKPSPVYTREARELRVEGEVLLQGCIYLQRLRPGTARGARPGPRSG